MIRRIQSHAIVNGVAFVIGEFVLMAVVVAVLAVIWMFHNMPLQAFAAIGIVANCFCVVGVGIHAWRAGQRGSPLRLLFSGTHRDRLSNEHPRMSEDTLAIGLATVIPFGLLVLTLIDLRVGTGGP